MSFQNKYLKYKNKYLELKKQYGGLLNNFDIVNRELEQLHEILPPDSDLITFINEIMYNHDFDILYIGIGSAFHGNTEEFQKYNQQYPFYLDHDKSILAINFDLEFPNNNTIFLPNTSYHEIERHDHIKEYIYNRSKILYSNLAIRITDHQTILFFDIINKLIIANNKLLIGAFYTGDSPFEKYFYDKYKSTGLIEPFNKLITYTANVECFPHQDRDYPLINPLTHEIIKSEFYLDDVDNIYNNLNSHLYESYDLIRELYTIAILRFRQNIINHFNLFINNDFSVYRVITSTTLRGDFNTESFNLENHRYIDQTIFAVLNTNVDKSLPLKKEDFVKDKLTNIYELECRKWCNALNKLKINNESNESVNDICDKLFSLITSNDEKIVNSIYSNIKVELRKLGLLYKVSI